MKKKLVTLSFPYVTNKKMNKEIALEILRTALVSYIEDSSGDGTEETKEIERAFKFIKNEILPRDKKIKKS